jgi:flagellar motility protein MotE (MotC chaperone)
MDSPNLEKIERQIADTYDAIAEQREVIQKLRHRANRKNVLEAEQRLTKIHESLATLREQRKAILHSLRRPKARAYSQDQGGKEQGKIS